MLIMRARGGYQVDEDEIREEARKAATMSKGIILELHAEEFSGRTVAEVIALGYTPQQIPYIRDELAKLELAFKDDADRTTQPLPNIEPDTPSVIKSRRTARVEVGKE